MSSGSETSVQYCAMVMEWRLQDQRNDGWPEICDLWRILENKLEYFTCQVVGTWELDLAGRK